MNPHFQHQYGFNQRGLLNKTSTSLHCRASSQRHFTVASKTHSKLVNTKLSTTYQSPFTERHSDHLRRSPTPTTGAKQYSCSQPTAAKASCCPARPRTSCACSALPEPSWHPWMLPGCTTTWLPSPKMAASLLLPPSHLMSRSVRPKGCFPHHPPSAPSLFLYWF